MQEQKEQDSPNTGNKEETKTHQSPKQKEARKGIQSALLVAATWITACQTTGTTQDQKAIKVLEAQNALIEAVMKERGSEKVQKAVADNDDLARAEAHLHAALESLKNANEKIKEAMKNDIPSPK